MWNLPVSNTNSNTGDNDNYYQNETKTDENLDYVDVAYGFDDYNGSSRQPTSRSNAASYGSSASTTGKSIQPPAADADGSPYKSRSISQRSSIQSYGQYGAGTGTATQKANTQAFRAFGGGVNSVNELLESDGDRQLRKIDGLKNMPGSRIVREEGRWQEWEAGNGATFYVCLVVDAATGDLQQPYGGQWDKPRVYEVADDGSKRTLSSAVTPVNNRRMVESLNRRQHEITSLCKCRMCTSGCAVCLFSLYIYPYIYSYPCVSVSLYSHQNRGLGEQQGSRPRPQWHQQHWWRQE